MNELEPVATYIDPGGEFCVRFCRNMPSRIRGTIVLDEDGFYNIYINADTPESVQREALDHEMGHFVRNDFDRRVS